MSKTATDIHWNERAASVANDIEVNIMDIFQRNLEYDYICRHLTRDIHLLEVGCGNGFSTDRFRACVKFVDAFDYSENMIARARRSFGETNNRFFVDNVLEPKSLSGPYDAVVCVRVLINLRDLEQQRQAIRNLVPLIRSEGLFILVEGFRNGFEELSRMRLSLGMPAIEPASINFYSRVEDLLPQLEEHFVLEDSFHLGAYDYLTRVVYPMIAGPENVKHNTIFSERCEQLARVFNPDAFAPMSRVRGFVLRRKP